jgi:hypothetical protein
VKPAQEQVVIILLVLEYELRGIHAVVYERGCPVSPCMIGADEDGVRRGSFSRAQVAMQGEYVGVTWSRGDWGVSMQQIGGVRKEPGEVKPGPANFIPIERDESGFRHARARRCEQGDSMTQLRQTPGQPDDHPLGTPVSPDGEEAMRVEGDVHGGPMYRPTFLVAKGRHA